MSDYPVEAILDKKYKTIPLTGKSKAYYYIRWQGYGDDENTWEPIENLTGCKKLISEFEKKFNENVHLKKIWIYCRKSPQKCQHLSLQVQMVDQNEAMTTPTILLQSLQIFPLIQD